jgi:hypothetical protein
LANKKAWGFVTLQYYTLYWLKMNSAGTLSASRITLPTQARQLTINRTVRLQQESEGKEISLAQTTAIIILRLS